MTRACTETKLPKRRKRPPRGLVIPELHAMLTAVKAVDQVAPTLSPMRHRYPKLMDRTSCPKPSDDPAEWGRNANGDVTNIFAFNAHMESVGEEDQSQPGWDAL